MVDINQILVYQFPNRKNSSDDLDIYIDVGASKTFWNMMDPSYLRGTSVTWRTSSSYLKERYEYYDTKNKDLPIEWFEFWDALCKTKFLFLVPDGYEKKPRLLSTEQKSQIAKAEKYNLRKCSVVTSHGIEKDCLFHCWSSVSDMNPSPQWGDSTSVLHRCVGIYEDKHGGINEAKPTNFKFTD